MEDVILGNNFKYPLENLKKHFIALGASGSGKTVLCKVIIEEAALKGIPSIIVDPQGDLASLAMPASKDSIKKYNIDAKKVEAYSNVQVVVFTPASSKGVPLCINPLTLMPKNVEKEELINILNQVSTSICKLLGYDLDKDNGKNAQTIMYLLLFDCWKRKLKLQTFDALGDLVMNIPESVKKDVAPFIKNEKDVALLARKIKFLTIGKKELLFQFGVQLNINDLLANKKRVNIIYLNTLQSQEEKDFFVSMLATSIYEWMLDNPSKDLQALFYIDEISTYLPAGIKMSASKEILKLLFKQARKYGIGCMASTQNPGDIDYKAFAQIGTWAIGRLTMKQDMQKVSSALQSMAYSKLDETINQFPKLKPGEFFIFCPDVYKKIERFEARWLLTEHKTLADDDLKAITPESLRKTFKAVRPEKTELREESPKTAKKGEFEHLPLKISKEQLDGILNRKKKKMFILFGPVRENIESIKLVLNPIFKTRVKFIRKKIFGQKMEEAESFFDGISGNILTFDDEEFKVYRWDQLLRLTETELSLVKALVDKGKPMTNAEIATALKLTESFVNKTANDLMKKKIVNYFGKAGRAHLWQLIMRFKLPSKLGSKIMSLSDDKVEGKQLDVKVNIGDIAKLVKCWFNGTIIEQSLIYYPFYEVNLIGKKGRRTIKISGIDGETFE